jgi:hypothetical protein
MSRTVMECIPNHVVEPPVQPIQLRAHAAQTYGCNVCMPPTGSFTGLRSFVGQQSATGGTTISLGHASDIWTCCFW